MNRYHYLFAVAAILIAWSCSTSKTGTDVSNNGLLEQLPHHIKLSWSTDPATSQAVSWRTRPSQKKSTLEYTVATASPFFEDEVQAIQAQTDTFRADDGLWYYHTVNLENLQPATTYSYRVGAENYWSEWSEFTTASGQEEPFSFLYFGDVQRFIHSKGSRALRQAVLDVPDAKFMIFAGDLIHRAAINTENWREFFPAGGWAFQHIPTIAAPGNHEHLWYPSEKKQREITPLWNMNFAFPHNGPEGMDGETFYVDYNNVRILSLNLCRTKPEEREAIYRWTEERLKEFTGDWVIATHHYHMESAARNRKPGIRYPELKALYEKYQVPLVLTGHEHLYARGRMEADYPVYVVSVAGPWMNAIRFEEWMERAGTSMQLFQEIQVSPQRLHFTAKTILGDVYDEFTITKEANGTMSFHQSEELGPESLVPPDNFEERYDKALVESYEADKMKYLKRPGRE